MKEEKLNSKQMKNLFKAISMLKTEEEAKLFMRDVATVSELTALAERWEAAQLIDKNIPYREINKLTGTSTTTVTRVAEWLHHGMGGYRLMLDRWKKK